jgi:hypothetical protein
MDIHEGVRYCEEDREAGPFVLRQAGTLNFVTSIRTNYYSRWGSPGEAVEIEVGWNNPSSLSYDTIERAIEAASQAHRISGVEIFIETQSAKVSYLADY